MAKKKSIEPAISEEAPVEEVPADLTLTDNGTVWTPVEVKPKSFSITLAGPRNQMLDYGINGVFAKLPCGVEIEVSEAVYNAVKAHIIPERD